MNEPEKKGGKSQSMREGKKDKQKVGQHLLQRHEEFLCNLLPLLGRHAPIVHVEQRVAG